MHENCSKLLSIILTFRVVAREIFVPGSESVASRASEALAPHGVGSRGPLKGPWWGPGATPRWGSRGQRPRKLLDFSLFRGLRSHLLTSKLEVKRLLLSPLKRLKSRNSKCQWHNLHNVIVIVNITVHVHKVWINLCIMHQWKHLKSKVIVSLPYLHSSLTL